MCPAVLISGQQGRLFQSTACNGACGSSHPRLLKPYGCALSEPDSSHSQVVPPMDNFPLCNAAGRTQRRDHPSRLTFLEATILICLKN